MLKLKATPFLMLLSKDIHHLEYDAHTQYRFNRFWAIFWLVNMPAVIVLDILFQKFWIEISVMYLVQASLWALVATHFGAMSSALSISQDTPKFAAIQEDIDSIQNKFEIPDANPSSGSPGQSLPGSTSA